MDIKFLNIFTCKGTELKDENRAFSMSKPRPVAVAPETLPGEARNKMFCK